MEIIGSSYMIITSKSLKVILSFFGEWYFNYHNVIMKIILTRHQHKSELFYQRYCRNQEN